MTPQEKADHLQAKYGARFSRLFKEAKKLPHLPRNLDYRANRLVEIADEFSAMIEPMATCKKECAYCCYQSVVISSWEADRIAKFTRRKKCEVAGFDPMNGRRDELVMEYAGITCPFLVEKKCAIYPVRPISCRLHFSLSDNYSPCDTRNNRGAPVAYFNMEPIKEIASVLYFSTNCKIADIREFFGMPER